MAQVVLNPSLAIDCNTIYIQWLMATNVSKVYDIATV